MSKTIASSLDLAGVKSDADAAQTTASAAIPLAQKAAANGVASLNGSSAVVQDPASKGQANGVASLDGTTKVPNAQVAGVLASTDLTDSASLERTANKGAANGYAPLNASSLVPQANLPVISAAHQALPISASQTAAFSVTTAFTIWLVNTTAGGFAASLPAANSVPNGFPAIFNNKGSANNLTVTPNGGDTTDVASVPFGTIVRLASDGVSAWRQW